ncbi:type II and III secretion system protein [Candidatus Poribacteria bacterium]|nr:type II and III secretion system protein [Candidatus Poribacteria bacterium]
MTPRLKSYVASTLIAGALAARAQGQVPASARLDIKTDVPAQGAPASATDIKNFNAQGEATNFYPKPSDTEQDILLRTTGQKNNYLVKTFPIHNTNAIEIQSYLLRSTAFESAIVEVMGKQGVIDPSTGEPVQFLIVTAPDFMMPGIEETVELCDIPGFVFYDGTGATNANGVAGAVTYTGKHRTASQLVSILSGTELGNVGVFLFPPFADNSLNSIYIVENPADIADDLAALEAFDKPPLQVEIKATIYELSDGDGHTLGLDWSAWKRYVSGNFNYTYQNDFDDTTVKSYSALLDLDAVVLTEFLNYLVDEGKADIVTETSITATNDFDPSSASGQVGRIARIFSGNTIPFVTPPSSTADVSVSPERKDIQEGIELLITPYIAAESVSLDVAVAVSNLMGYVPETHFPIVSTQEATSFNSVGFGQTIVIGGLDRRVIVEETTGVPFLKDAPVLGYLFGKESKATRTSKLIVTLTPELKSPFESDTPEVALAE